MPVVSMAEVRLASLRGSRLEAAATLRQASGLSLKVSKHVVGRLPFTVRAHTFFMPALRRCFEIGDGR